MITALVLGGMLTRAYCVSQCSHAIDSLCHRYKTHACERSIIRLCRHRRLICFAAGAV